LPDGRVLVAGGGHYNAGTGPGQFSAQFYSPPYLFNGSRPTITNAPAGTTYGSSFSVSTPDAASIRSSTSSRSAPTRTRATWTSTSSR
jgi:hypothetical protein